MLKTLTCAMLLLIFSSSAFAECTKTPRGRTVCDDGQTAGGYNPKTGNAWKSQQNPNGSTTSQTNRGGQAVTKNGKGAVKTPGGKTCVKTANKQDCTD
jgi:hypothetical protein